MTWVKFPTHESKLSTEGNNNIFENVFFLFKLWLNLFNHFFLSLFLSVFSLWLLLLSHKLTDWVGILWNASIFNRQVPGHMKWIYIFTCFLINQGVADGLYAAFICLHHLRSICPLDKDIFWVLMELFFLIMAKEFTSENLHEIRPVFMRISCSESVGQTKLWCLQHWTLWSIKIFSNDLINLWLRFACSKDQIYIQIHVRPPAW